MRALAAAIACALLASGCASPRPAVHDPNGETGYNRRELEPRPGLFTGSDGEWTLYHSDAPAPPPQPAVDDVPAARRTLPCARGHDCDPPLESE